MLGAGVRWGAGRLADAVGMTTAGASGRHVKVYATTEGWYAEDLGSTNGTLLDDSALRPGSPQPMRAGAVLTVGRTTLELRG